MKWYFSIVAWIADAIKTKAELTEDNSIDGRLKRIEDKLKEIDQKTLWIAVFASALPVYLIGFAGSLNNAIQVITFEWGNLISLVVGSLLVLTAMIRLKEKPRNVFIAMALTFGPLIIVSTFNFVRFILL